MSQKKFKGFINNKVSKTPKPTNKEKAVFNLIGFINTRIITLLQHPFLRNVSTVAVGPMVSQTLSILLSPIITRLYDPVAFGALGVFLSALSILVPVSNLSYSYAIIMPKKDMDGLRILKFSLFFAFFISLITFFVILFYNQPITTLLKLDGFTVYLYFLPLTLFFTTAAIVYDQWIVRKKLFKASSIILVAQSLISNGSLIGLGLFLPQYASLIGVNIFTRGFYALGSFVVSRKRITKPDHQTMKSEPILKGRTLELLKEYRDFPIFRTPQILISTLSYNLPVMLMAIFSGPAVSGLYLLAHRVLKLPSIILSESVGKVFQQRVIERAHAAESLQPLILKTTISLLALGFIPFGTIILFGPFLFSFIFGSEWVLAGTFARWIAIWVLVNFSSVPVVMAIPLLNLQKQYLIFEFVSLIFGMMSLIFGFILLKNDVTAVALFSCVGALLTSAWMIIVIMMSKDRNRYQIVEEENSY